MLNRKNIMLKSSIDFIMLNEREIERDRLISSEIASLFNENPRFSGRFVSFRKEPSASRSFVLRWRIPRRLEYDIGSQVARVASRFNGGIYHI